MRSIVCVLLLIGSYNTTNSQTNTYAVRTVAFYNVENLFDTLNDPKTFDDSRTPNGKDKWNKARYEKKIANIAQVISEIGKEKTQQAPDIIGLAEVENLKVLKDLTNHPSLELYQYNIIHANSPDRRGIDVALLFKQGVFTPIDYKSYTLLLKDEFNKRIYTRDQLLVSGMLDGEIFYFIVNHWPSRRGGENRSKHKRLKAAILNKQIIDSIQKIDSLARIISMGDFNDDPTNASFKQILKTKSRNNNIHTFDLINPMDALFKKGYGSLAYGDSWNLFDQFYFSATLINPNQKSYQFWKANIYNPPYLTVSKGKYKGYPFRTYAGGAYTGGYSDHFPIYLYLIKAQ
ncbi:endonuclease/exonuclease/phosphatase family protein [Ascidiimonas sp. W6]|uniref:endonuclease/exonuclease/phosphatase family protein n=1 Tax=Ascidiimonas meishanensis TaxID=3128903 RepID=UPI0030EF7C7E